MDNIQIKSKSELDLLLSEVKNSIVKDVTIQLDSNELINLSHMTLDNVMFDHCDLSNIHISNSIIIGCTFTCCTFYKAGFDYSKFDCCTFNECIMQEASFYSTTLSDVHIHSCNLRGASFKSATLHAVGWYETDRAFCDFDYSSFELRCANARYTTDMKFITQVFAHLATLRVVDETVEFKEVMDYVKRQVTGSKYIGRKYLKYTDEELSDIAASCHRISSGKEVKKGIKGVK